MRFLFFFTLFFSGCYSYAAYECHLTDDQAGNRFVDCRIGPKPDGYTRICPAINGEKDAEHYVLTDGKCTLDLSIVTSTETYIAQKTAELKKTKEDLEKDKTDLQAECAKAKSAIETAICKILLSQ